MRTLLWGVFCACSWTWCIGMFLPLVLLDRYGWAGFAAFAVPNVIGCTLFGYVLTRRRSEELVVEHRSAMRWFSVITVAFHVYFAGFLVTGALGEAASPAVAATAGICLLSCGVLLSRLSSAAWLAASVLVYAVSLTAGIVLAVKGHEDLEWLGGHEPPDLVYLLPVFALGFLLCPMLDLTFHRARQESPSRHSFAVFGATFAVMIGITCLYGEDGGLRIVPLVVAHLVAQSAFTVGAHLREVRRTTEPGKVTAVWLAVPLLAIPVALLPLLAPDPDQAGVNTYLRFIVFYALLFPAYVLLFIGPWRPHARSRRTVTWFWAVVLLAAPCYELGFLHQMAWLLPPVVAALVALALLLPRGTARA